MAFQKKNKKRKEHKSLSVSVASDSTYGPCTSPNHKHISWTLLMQGLRGRQYREYILDLWRRSNFSKFMNFVLEDQLNFRKNPKTTLAHMPRVDSDRDVNSSNNTPAACFQSHWALTCPRAGRCKRTVVKVHLNGHTYPRLPSNSALWLESATVLQKCPDAQHTYYLVLLGFLSDKLLQAPGLSSTYTTVHLNGELPCSTTRSSLKVHSLRNLSEIITILTIAFMPGRKATIILSCCCF